jgi:hypothetical protein
MTQGQKKRAQSPQERPVDLDKLKAFWDFMSQHFPGLLIDLSLFNYKAGEFNKPKVSKRDCPRKSKVPVEKAYETVLELLPEYHKGKDILWRPSDYYKEHRDALVSLVWLDDFKLDNPLGLTPLVCLQTSPKKYQAIFKLSEPATVDDADTVQKAMVKVLGLGDNAATSFFHHRRMPGLANGKYEDDPLVIFTVPETHSRISIRDIENTLREEGEGGVAKNNGVGEDTEPKPQQRQETQRQGLDPQTKKVKGRYIKPVVPVNYKPVLIKERSAFIKRRPDGTIDDSATDMAWATHIARMTYTEGWDDANIVLTIYEELGNESPELQRRKKTPKHARQYLYITAWKALMKVKNSDETGADPRVVFGK